MDEATNRMDQLIGDMLNLTRLNKADIRKERVDVSRMCRDILAGLARQHPLRKVRTSVQDNIAVIGDRGLLRIAFENLLGNAWKFTGKTESAAVEVGAVPFEGKICCFVRDNGAGFDMARAETLFSAFQRFHSNDDFPGTGVGLATVQRVVHRHDGRIWAEAEPGKGATFYLTLQPADAP